MIELMVSIWVIGWLFMLGVIIVECSGKPLHIVGWSVLALAAWPTMLGVTWRAIHDQ